MSLSKRSKANNDSIELPFRNGKILQISELEQRHQQCLTSQLKAYKGKEIQTSHLSSTKRKSEFKSSRSKDREKSKQNFKQGRSSTHSIIEEGFQSQTSRRYQGQVQRQKGSSNRESRITYPGLCKIVDERNNMILAYEKQICSLIEEVASLRKNNEALKSQEANAKTEDLQRLRQYESANQTNLKELQILKDGIKQMKLKVQQLTSQKKSLSHKYNQALKETQELTIQFNSLLTQSKEKTNIQQDHDRLLSDYAAFKEKHLNCKQNEIQRVTNEQRCRNLEKRINQYIVKNNEIQGQCNEVQIKYYRLQKDNDQLRSTHQQNQTLMNQLKGKIEAEKQWSSQETDKLKNKLKKVEEELSFHVNWLQELDRNRINLTKQLQEKQQQLVESKGQQEILTKQNIILQEKTKQCQASLKQCKILYQQHVQVSKTENKCYQTDKKHLQKNIEQLLAEKQQLQKVLMMQMQMSQKASELIQENNRLCDLMQKKEAELLTIQTYHSQQNTTLNSLRQQNIRQNSQLQNSENIQQKLHAQIGEHLQRYQNLSQALQQSECRSSSIQISLQKTQREVHESQRQLRQRYQLEIAQLKQSSQGQHQHYEGIIRQVEILQEQLYKRKAEFSTQKHKLQAKVEERGKRITQLEQILSEINIDLSTVKQELKSYRIHIQTIQEDNRKIEQRENNKQNQIDNLNEQVQYFKKKYNEVFTTNSEQTERLRESQLQYKSLINQFQLVQRINQQLTQEVELLKNKIVNNNQKELNVNELRAKLSRREAELVQLESKLTIVQQQYKTAKIGRVRLEHEKEETALHMNSSIQSMKSTLQRTIDGLAKEAYELKTKIYYLEEQLASKEAQLSQISRQQNQQRLQTMRTLEEHSQRQRLFKSRIIQLEKEKEQSLKNAETIVRRSRGLEAEVPFLSKKIQQQETQMSELNAKKHQLERQLKDLIQQNREFQQCKGEVKVLKETIEVLEGRLQKSDHSTMRLSNQLTQVLQSRVTPELKSRIQYMEESRFEMNRELDNSKVTVQILKNENESLHKIMTQQLNKRKTVIEELIREKQDLYDQIRKG